MANFRNKTIPLLKDIPKSLEVIKVPIKEPYVIYKLLTGRKKREDSCRISDRKEKKSFLQDFAVWVRGNFIPDARMLWIKPSVKALQQWLNTNTVDAIASTRPSPHLPSDSHAANRQNGIALVSRFP